MTALADMFLDLRDSSIVETDERLRREALEEGGEKPRRYFDLHVQTDVSFVNDCIRSGTKGKPTGLDRITGAVLGRKPLPKNYRSLVAKAFGAVFSRGDKADAFGKDIAASLTRSVNYVFKVADEIVCDPIVVNLYTDFEAEHAAHTEAGKGMDDYEKCLATITRSLKAGGQDLVHVDVAQRLFLAAYDGAYITAHDWIVALFSRYCTDPYRNHEFAERILCYRSVSGCLGRAKSDIREVRNSLAHPPRPPKSVDTVPVKVSHADLDLGGGDLAVRNVCMICKAHAGPLITMVCLSLVAYGIVYGVYE